VALVAAAVLLASRDLMNLQARAVSGLLKQAGIQHEVIDSDEELSRTETGGFSRGGDVRTAAAPVVRVRTPEPRPGSAAQAVAVVAAALAVCAALTKARRVPAPVKGAVAAVVVVWSISAVYAAWFGPLPPLDTRSVPIDWRQVPLVPMVVVSFLFWYDLYPLPGSFMLKTAWVGVALAAMAAFSMVRLATVLAAYATFGPGVFLVAHQVGGTFWDLVPGVAVLALAHPSIEWTSRIGPRLAWWAR